MDSALLEKIKTLRNETEAPLGLCREALEASKGDLEQAKAYLRQKGAALLEKKAGEQAGQGLIEGYLHFNGKVGALVDLRSQTDFVAKSPEFKSLAHEIALQAATMKPQYLNPDSIPAAVLEIKKKEIMADPSVAAAKAELQEKIVAGKLQKWYAEVCLIEQPYFKDEAITIRDLINGLANKFGEKIELKRFIRLALND